MITFLSYNCLKSYTISSLATGNFDLYVKNVMQWKVREQVETKLKVVLR